ncbi:MAG: type II secretion system F family protein [Mycobacteriales bacterium]
MSIDTARPAETSPVPAPPATSARPSMLRRLMAFEITKKKVPRRDLMHFSRQLSVFVRAGIPMLEALDTITEEMGNKAFLAALTDVKEQLRGGGTFAAAAAAHPEAFPPVYANILASAECTGNLDEALDRIATYKERDMEARRKLKEALFYPIVVLAMSVVVVVILTVFVIPRFETFFKSFDAKLPLPTRILLSIARFFTDYGLYLLGGLAVLALVVALALRTERGKAARDAALLKVPVLGDLVQHAILERFCRILSAMVLSGVPLPDALVVTTASTNNAVFRKGLATAREGMLRGEGLAGPMAASNLFPAAARQMFRVGESTGTLDSQLETAATYFDRELDYKLSRFTSLFEPAVIVFAGLVVGFVAIALISAMYGIYRQVNIGG